MRGLKDVRNRRDDSLSRVAWDQLEALFAIYYRGQDYRVEDCGTGATRQRFDGDIDLKLRKDGEYILVQCKHWNAKQVPHNEVQQLLGIMVNECATGAILVSSGEFTVAARQAADKLGGNNGVRFTSLAPTSGTDPVLTKGSGQLIEDQCKKQRGKGWSIGR